MHEPLELLGNEARLASNTTNPHQPQALAPLSMSGKLSQCYRDHSRHTHKTLKTEQSVYAYTLTYT